MRNITRLVVFILLFALLTACQRNIFQSPTVAPATFRDVPALRLNYRFEADVPAPPEMNPATPAEDRNAAVQNDFDQNRPQELLDKTVTSPDKQRVLAVYHRVGDAPYEFRLDMYSADGRILRRVSPDAMAVHFPDTITWSPDSQTLAFVGMIRAGQDNSQTMPNPADGNTNTSANSAVNANTETNTNTENTENTNIAPAATPPVEQARPVLTFRTEQIYICSSDGSDVRLITQNEGLIYFYYVWSPDSSMLAALAVTYREWGGLQMQAESKGEQFVPFGRPRIVEKTGRERRLDDAPTQVRPVWSPDSAKVAVAFDTQVRVYDAIGNQPTQAAIPLRNQLLISADAYDKNLQRQEQGIADTGNAAANSDANANQTGGALPDESTLVSFNPITELRWTEDTMLYLQTGYIKRMKNEADSVRSYLRWHRLIFSPQATVIK